LGNGIWNINILAFVSVRIQIPTERNCKDAPSFPGLTSNGVNLTGQYKKSFGARMLELIMKLFHSGSRFKIINIEDIFTVLGQTSRVSYSQQNKKNEYTQMSERGCFGE
jgi:hypothetical protein